MRLTLEVLRYVELSNINGSSTLLRHRLKLSILETYKSFHGMNANCLHNVFKLNGTSHERQLDKLAQAKRRTTSNGLRSFSYLGSKLCYDIVNSDLGIVSYNFNDVNCAGPLSMSAENLVNRHISDTLIWPKAANCFFTSQHILFFLLEVIRLGLSLIGKHYFSDITTSYTHPYTVTHTNTGNNSAEL